jgi:hypothetical protein
MKKSTLSVGCLSPLIVGILSISCDKAEPVLSIAPETLNVEAAAAGHTIAVTSNAAWTASENAEWLSLTPATGSGNGIITVNVETNTTAESRTATITVKAGSLSQTVTVTQATQETAVFTFTGGEATFTATARNMAIDWGDGTTNEYTNVKYSSFSHIYQSSANRTVTIKAEELTHFMCSNLHLTALDVSSCPELLRLWCFTNQLTALDVSGNAKLTDLECQSNRITALDVSRNTELMTLSFNDNQLTTLDVSRNTKLSGLACYNNQLAALDVSHNTKLTELSCYNNQLTAAALNALFTSLPTVESGTIHISGNPGISGCNRSTATAKGWNFIN